MPPLRATHRRCALLYEPVGVHDYVVYCADRWYHSGVVRYGPDTVEIARERDTFNHEIFRFNISKSIGLAHVIEVIGDSREALRGLRDGFFDVTSTRRRARTSGLPANTTSRRSTTGSPRTRPTRLSPPALSGRWMRLLFLAGVRCRRWAPASAASCRGSSTAGCATWRSKPTRGPDATSARRTRCPARPGHGRTSRSSRRPSTWWQASISSST